MMVESRPALSTAQSVGHRKVAVVTGGASGIGKAIARRLVAEGMQLLIADIEETALEAAALEIGAQAICVDASSAQSMQALAAEAQRRFGGVDLFCSNAGVASTGRIADMTPADWHWLLGVNVWGLIHGISAFLPLLRSRPDGGHLAVTASEAGFHVAPNIGGYCVSKSAAVGIAEGLATELREEGANVGVTILCPGPVSTRLGSSQRNRPAGLQQGSLTDSDLEATEAGAALRWATPESVAETLLDAIRNGDLYAFTHPEMAGPIEARHRAIADALARAGGAR
jgi:NAD(P)-dependent dehydrogenase (short-subunit alcohol dehydrogenase family)